MKKSKRRKILKALLVAILTGITTTSWAADSNKATETKTATNNKVEHKFTIEQGLYAAGYTVGINLGLQDGITEEQLSYLIDGLKAAAGLKQTYNVSLTKEQIQAAVKQLAERANERKQAVEKLKYQKNIDEGSKFFNDFVKKKGVKKDSTGYAYLIKKQGTGSAIKATDTVTITYVGTLPDGKVFDKVGDKKTPAVFNLSQVIPGFRSAVTKIKDGGIIEFVLPYNLAFGDKGVGPVAPYTTIKFEVEVISHEASTVKSDATQRKK